jgi:hypothetical protein
VDSIRCLQGTPHDAWKVPHDLEQAERFHEEEVQETVVGTSLRGEHEPAPDGRTHGNGGKERVPLEQRPVSLLRQVAGEPGCADLQASRGESTEGGQQRPAVLQEPREPGERITPAKHFHVDPHAQQVHEHRGPTLPPGFSHVQPSRYPRGEESHDGLDPAPGSHHPVEVVSGSHGKHHEGKSVGKTLVPESVRHLVQRAVSPNDDEGTGLPTPGQFRNECARVARGVGAEDPKIVTRGAEGLLQFGEDTAPPSAPGIGVGENVDSAQVELRLRTTRRSSARVRTGVDEEWSGVVGQGTGR